MKRWISVGLTLAVIGLCAWTYRETSAASDRGRDLAETSPGQTRLVLRLESVTDGHPGGTPSQGAARIAPSGLVPVEVLNGPGEPL